jgi:hypothetical protein
MKRSEFKNKIRAAVLAEASKKKGKKSEEESPEIDATDMEDDLEFSMEDEPDMSGFGDGERVDVNMDTELDLDAGSSEAKKAFNELTDAYRAAKELGDKKLIQQLANTITYFNKNIILQNP